MYVYIYIYIYIEREREREIYHNIIYYFVEVRSVRAQSAMVLHAHKKAASSTRSERRVQCIDAIIYRNTI